MEYDVREHAQVEVEERSARVNVPLLQNVVVWLSRVLPPVRSPPVSGIPSLSRVVAVERLTVELDGCIRRT